MDHLKRVAWLDSLRGVTILLVIMFHCVLAAWTFTPSGANDFLWSWMIGGLSICLSAVRMPAFFLCSGILFSFTMKRGWPWFLRSRLLFAAWVILVWTLIDYAALFAGVNLYSWDMNIINVPWRNFLWVPYGNLWFVYATAILGAFALLVRNVDKKLVLLTVALCPVIFFLSLGASGEKYQDMAYFPVFPYWLNLLFTNLVARGFLFFMIGVIFGGRILALDFQNFGIFVRAALIFALCTFLFVVLRKVSGNYRALAQFLVSIPYTLSAVYLFVFAMGRSPILSDAFGRIGRRSLELFLAHHAFLGGICILSMRLFPDMGRTPFFVISFPTVVLLSYLSAVYLRRVGFGFLFAAPAWLRKFVGGRPAPAPASPQQG